MDEISEGSGYYRSADVYYTADIAPCGDDMKMKLNGRTVYIPGTLYSIALCLPAVVLSVFLLSNVYDIKGRGDPIGLVIAAGFILLYLILLKTGRKLFGFTEKIFMSCGDEEKAHGKAILTERVMFVVFLILNMLILITII